MREQMVVKLRCDFIRNKNLFEPKLNLGIDRDFNNEIERPLTNIPANCDL